MKRNKTNLRNPQKQTSYIPYSIYSTHKFARKEVQHQRSNAQQTISYLQRQAKKTQKQLYNKQKSLINYYNLKQDRFDEKKRKDEWAKKREMQLEEQKRLNNQLRQSSVSKRSQAKSKWQSYNKRSAVDIKRETSEWQRRINEEKQLENSLLRKRNQLFSRALALGTEHSRVRSLYKKKFESSKVKSDLINIQQKIKEKQLKYISFLSTRQKQLLDIVQKNRIQNHHYKNTLQQMKTIPFDQLTKRVTKSVNKSSSLSNHSDSLII